MLEGLGQITSADYEGFGSQSLHSVYVDYAKTTEGILVGACRIPWGLGVG